MKKLVSRRKFLAGSGAAASMALLGCDSTTYLPPDVRGGLMGAADVLTMATQRLLLSGQPLAQEHDVSDITRDFPTWGNTNPRQEDYQDLLSGEFVDWRLPVGGLVNRPMSFSLEELKRLPQRTQITMHICEQGWSAIGQ